MRIIIKNGTILTPLRQIEGGGLIIKDNEIESIFKNQGEFSRQNADKVVDVSGKYIAPGFIDLHTHGGGGHDFMDGTQEAFIGACNTHLKHGTTSIVPTTLTSSEEETSAILKSFNQVNGSNKIDSHILGLHLEGPYFAAEQKGAQDEKYIRNPKTEEYQQILQNCPGIIRWTAAPELEGALEMGKILRQQGILPSIGHSNAVYEEVLSAFENGFKHITHLYSGMSGVRRINAYRYSGVVESAYLIEEMSVEIIADGCHLPPSLLKLIYKIKGSDKIALVTDSMRGAGMPEGSYILGSKKEGQEVIVEEGVAKLKDRTAFAGSVATADRLVRTMVKQADIPLKEAVKMMTLTPARIIGVEDTRGSISTGKIADLVIFDENINVEKVMAAGKLV